MAIDPTRGIAGLKGALRYVRAYRDQTFVVKLGGDSIDDAVAALRAYEERIGWRR